MLIINYSLLVPIKAKSLFTEVSKRTGLPQDVVEKVINFYYDQLKDKLTNLEFSAFVLEGLGKFRIKSTIVPKEEARLSSLIKCGLAKGNDITPKRQGDLRNAQENLPKVQNIKKMLEDIKQKKEFITLYKITYKDDKITKALEGQMENTQGISSLPKEE